MTQSMVSSAPSCRHHGDVNILQKSAAVLNTAVRPMVRAPFLAPILGRSMTVLTYTGRRSGKTVELPVGYSRRGDEVVVGVAMPDRKTWWKNFTGDGAPLSLTLDGGTHTGHAVAERDGEGRVAVRITLDPM